jgi:hypothetical protein
MPCNDIPAIIYHNPWVPSGTYINCDPFHGLSHFAINFEFPANKACFICRILVASNAIKTIDNEMINLVNLHYLLFELHSTRPKFDV